MTSLILAIHTLQRLVGATPKPLWMLCIDYLPVYQHHTGSKKQTPRKKILNKQCWCKHHEMPPVIDPTIHTAFILHQKMLKRTVEQNTDIVA